VTDIDVNRLAVAGNIVRENVGRVGVSGGIENGRLISRGITF